MSLLLIPEINNNIYSRSCAHVFRTNQNKLYQCTICDDGYIRCLNCHNDGMQYILQDITVSIRLIIDDKY